MDTATVECFTDVDPTDALIVVAFHGTGAAAPIAAGYIKTALDLPLVGHIRTPLIGPVVHVSSGLATSPIRIFGGDIVCHLDRRCERLFIVSADLPLPPEIVDTLAQAILEWGKTARMVLALDAVPRDESDDEPDVYAIGDGGEALEQLANARAEPLGGGVIVGMTAAILGRARDYGPHGGALLVEAAGDHPDGRAAARLIAAFDPLVPQIAVDPEPLLKEALVLEEQMDKALREAKAATERRPAHTFI